jgi:hypothetical protein
MAENHIVMVSVKDSGFNPETNMKENIHGIDRTVE